MRIYADPWKTSVERRVASLRSSEEKLTERSGGCPPIPLEPAPFPHHSTKVKSLD